MSKGSIYRDIEGIEEAIRKLNDKAAKLAEKSPFSEGTESKLTYSEGDAAEQLELIDDDSSASFRAWMHTTGSLASFLEKDVLAMQKADSGGTE